MKYFVLLFFVIGGLLLAYRSYTNGAHKEQEYQIVSFDAKGKKTFLKTIKASLLKDAAGIIPAPGYQLTSIAPDGKPTDIGPVIRDDGALRIFAAGTYKYVYSTDPKGNPDEKLATTVPTQSSNGSLDVIFALRRKHRGG